MEPASPKKINKYEVIDVIGRGGMGVVYKAIDRSLDRLVAIKMVTNADPEQGEVLKRFYREAQCTANLRHPNIVTVYDLGEVDGFPYLVMEYLAGQSLESMLLQPMTLLDKVSYIRQVCNGLQYAHSRNPSIVHRDIKPGNIVVLEDGSVKIVDFGIARLGASRNTRPGQLMGSYHYMSPEQIKDAELDGRTDIFSAGVVLYQLLTLKLPFEGSGIAQTLHMIVQNPTPPLNRYIKEYPAGLDTIIYRALAKDRSERYQTAADFAFDLLAMEETLKRELFSAHIERAEEFLRKGELEQSRLELAEILKVDHQHARANQLMRELQQAVAIQQRKQRARDLRARAQEILQQGRLAEALSAMEQAVQLDSSNSELLAFRDHLLELNARAERFNEILSRAERACASRDLDTAARAVDEAIQLDPTSARARSFKAIVDAKIAEREKERQVQELLSSARNQIASRQFSDALRQLRNVQSLNPTVSGLTDLVNVAETGYQQELRQRALDKAIADIHEALDRPEPFLARSLALAALEKFPDNRQLLELKKTAEQQLSDRKRDKAIALIQALIAAGEFESAERQVGVTRRELGDSAPLRHIEEQIKADKARCVQDEFNSALSEAEHLLAFDADTQATAKLDSVAQLTASVPPDLRARYQQLRGSINQRLADKKKKQQEQSWRSAGPTPPPPPSPPLHPRPGGIIDAGSTGTTTSGGPFLPNGAFLRQTDKQDHSIAELTPVDGIAASDVNAEAITTDLPAVQPSKAAPPASSSPDRTLTLFGTYQSPSTPKESQPKGPPTFTSTGIELTQSLRGPTAWPEEALHAVEKQLAAYIGPLARVVVRRAATKTSDPEDFYTMIATSIDLRSDRQRFLAQKIRLGPGQPVAGAAAGTPSLNQKATPASSGSRDELTPAAIERAARLLAPYAGPISVVLARKAAQRADCLRSLYVILAEHVEREPERVRFLRDAGFPDAA